MEDEWSVDRARLRCALGDHPTWSGARLARELGRSRSWVKKWRRRLAAAPPDDEAVLCSRSRARIRPPPTVPRLAVERVLAIRDEPPDGLQRVPGPRAISTSCNGTRPCGRPECRRRGRRPRCGGSFATTGASRGAGRASTSRWHFRRR